MSFKDILSKLPFNKTKEEKYENYFSLQISYNRVTATVWTIHKNNLTVLNAATATFENGDDFKSDQTLASLADAANYCLDEALADINPEPTQLLFGVLESWLHEENIKPEYLKILKKLVKELEVAPMAYVSTAHAISHLLQKQQGVPLTAILVEAADPLVINVVKAGKTQATVIQPRGEHIGKDIEMGLATIDTIEVLPSKMLLYTLEGAGAGQELEKLKDELSSFPWMNQLPFLHLPRVDALPSTLAAQAICFAGGSELFPHITSQIIDYTAKKPPSTKLSHKVDLVEESELPSRHSRISAAAAEAGFIAEDVKNDEKEDVFENELEDDSADGMSPEEDWEEEEERRDELIEHPGKSELAQRRSSQVGPAESSGNMLLGPLAILKSGKSKLLLIPFAIIIVLIVLAFLFTKAKVTMFVDMKTIENTSEVVADPSITTVDETAKKIPGKILETDETGTDKGTATGKKKVGDPAKGAIVLYNKTSAPKTFSQGTVITGPNNLQFSLDSSVNVASQSAVEGGIAFGKATGSVTAAAIGPEGNLPAGNDLTIKGQSSDQYSAKVDQAFSGGVSKDVTVVTADDQKKILAKVSADLKQKAQQDLQGKLTGDSKILAESFSENITKSSYTKNVGDQATDFTLTLNAHYKGTAYSDSDLKSILGKLAQVNNPDKDKFELDMSKTETQTDVSKVDKDTGKLYFTAKLKAKLMPKFDTEQIKKQIAGKSPKEAIARLQSLDNVIEANIQMTPSLPGPFARLPFMVKNISITVTTK